MTTSDVVLHALAGKFLAHIQDPGYNPEERRRRYLLERQLKGRKPAAGKSAPVKRLAKGRPAAAPKVKKSGANMGKVKSNRSEAQARVAAIEGRLGTLKKVLGDLLAQKAAGKAEEPAKKSATKSEGPAEKQTAQQKSKQAAASKEHYEKNKNEILKKAKDEAKLSPKQIDEKIAKVRTQISAAQRELNNARTKVKRS